MYLSNRDIKWAIESGTLIVIPEPEKDGYGEMSIDLHLDGLDHVKVWDHKKLADFQKTAGGTGGPGSHTHTPLLRLGDFDWDKFSDDYLAVVPDEPPSYPPHVPGCQPVYRRGNEVIIPHGGFVLWTTQEVIGTPKENPEFVTFVNAKSTRARTGILVHFTAPTINSGWNGKITLEIANFGPFTFALKPGDVIAQLIVAHISSRPDLSLMKRKSVTMGQIDPSGQSKSKPRRKKTG
jgi:dCTP deaminase